MIKLTIMYTYGKKYIRFDGVMYLKSISEKSEIVRRIQFQDPEIDKHWLITVSELFSGMAPRVASFGSSYGG